LLQSAAPGQAGESDTIVWQVSSGSVKDPAVQQDISAMLDKVAHANSVASVVSPYTPQGASQISPDGTIAYAHVNWNARGQQIPKADVSNVISIAKSARSPNVDVELGGLVIQAANQTSQNTSELYGFIAAAIILLLAFGSFFSMLLPLISAIFSLVTAGFT